MIASLGVVMLLGACGTHSLQSFHTKYLGVDVNDKGYIVGLRNVTRKDPMNFSPANQPSPLLSLYDEETQQYFYPEKAVYDKGGQTVRLSYSNGSVATVKIQETDKYLKLTLQDLSPRNGIDDVQWGKYYTSINNLLGEVIGVARDTSKTVNYDIGVLALNDNTIGGLSRYTSDSQAGGYMVHTPDPIQYPLPVELHEGQQFTMGGDGFSDVAFYNRKEPYFRMMYGTSAGVDESGKIYICYHSRDRRKGKMIYSPEGWPIFVNNEPNHLQRQDVPGVDYIGSSIALWGSPDSTALMDVIQDIVLKEGLPHPMFRGKWVKDPTSFTPDLMTYGNLYDSIASYAKAMDLHVIHAYDQPFIHAERGNKGFLDGFDQAKKPYHFTTGDLSHKEYANLLAKDSIILGGTCITNALAPGSKDGSPIPSDSICIQHRRFLTQGISPADTMIYIDDPKYMNEIGCWEAHEKSLNMVKIGKELIHYLGVSKEAPYRLLHVTRGYWGTTPVQHHAGDAVDKVQVTVGWGYQGMVPNLELQDEIGKYYADMSKNSGIGLIDFDGQEFLFHSGFGNYSVKRFYRNMFDEARKLHLPDIRFTGATLSEGSWHYQSIWNVGGGKNMYDAQTREWGSTTSQGKDLRDVTYANFFPSSFGGNFPITAKSTVEEYEHIEATAVGYGATYFLKVSQKDVESCPYKYQIFNVIKTWEAARRANAFPEHIKQLLRNPKLSWRLANGSTPHTWTLYQLDHGNICHTYHLTSHD